MCHQQHLSESVYCTANPPSEARYVKAKVTGHGRDEFYVHHLVIRSKGELVDQAMQVSHLCHQKRCITVDHIIQETGEANRARQMCVGARHLVIPCDCGRTHIVNPCRHTPVCVCSLSSIVISK